MSENKHTRGPWEVQRRANQTYVYSVPTSEDICELVPWSEYVDETDARLIAAAPDLLDAAQRVLRQWDTPNWKLTEYTATFIGELRAAVAKAEGK